MIPNRSLGYQIIGFDNPKIKLPLSHGYKIIYCQLFKKRKAEVKSDTIKSDLIVDLVKAPWQGLVFRIDLLEVLNDYGHLNQQWYHKAADIDPSG